MHVDVDGTQRRVIPPSRLNSDGRDGNIRATWFAALVHCFFSSSGELDLASPWSSLCNLAA